MTMRLKTTDVVKLLPTWTFPQGKAAPVWGGPQGYHIGVVQKVETHEHDKTKHVAVVEWDTGEKASFPESALAITTADERDVALDSRVSCGPVDRDIFVLIRTSIGNFCLNVIEASPFGSKHPDVKFVAGITKHCLSTQNSNYNIVGSMLSQEDYVELRTSCLFTAAQQIFHMWELPPLDSVPLPLPEYQTIKDASACAPSVGPSLLFFHLPSNLNDYADKEPVGAT